MRIRKKKHLEERLEQVNRVLLNPPRDVLNVKLAVQDKKYFNFKEMFGNDNPVEIEIGCGKGGFIIEKAKGNPNINFIAVELLQNIIVMAAENAVKDGLTNLMFLNSGAEYLARYLPENSISNVYLNFSPPFPQKGYEGRRLTSNWFINTYKSILKSGGAVYQKTDDREFFEYSKEKFIEHGFLVEEVSELIDNGVMDNVETEYEKKFRALGIKINALIAKKV